MDKELIFRQAVPHEVSHIMQIIRQAQAQMYAAGSRQWQDGYPAVQVFQADLAQGCCHVLTYERDLAAVFSLTRGPEMGYDAITDGKWRGDGPYAVLHRSAVADRFRGAGVADRLLESARELARKLGVGWLRADTHRKNKAMQNLLRRGGFQYRGNVLVNTDPGHDPRRLAFEVRLAGRPLTGEERP